jgi:diacylglycerol kinase (ATP)
MRRLHSIDLTGNDLILGEKSTARGSRLSPRFGIASWVTMPQHAARIPNRPRSLGTMKNRPFIARLGFALTGIGQAWKRERSFRTQAALAAAALVVTVMLRPGWIWVAAVALSIAFVLAVELINSAFESTLDRLHPEIAPQIELAKDMAAGAVLIAALGAATVGATMLLQLLLR